MKIARAIFVAATIALASPALAVDFSTKLTQIDGKPFLDDDTKKPTETTLATVVQRALLTSYQDEASSITGEEKFKRWRLAEKIQNAVEAGKPNVDLSAEDVAMAKKLVAKAYNPLIVGQAWSLLDPGGSKDK